MVGFQVRWVGAESGKRLARKRKCQMSAAERMTINDLVAAARRRLDRLTPEQARAAAVRGAVLIDIRSEHQRECDGLIPGAAFCPRNALEWRVDPASGHGDPALGGDLDRQIILVCDEGYQSSLAAATLQDLGFVRATDVDGGFQAWRAAGLPVDRTMDIRIPNAVRPRQDVDPASSSPPTAA
jgi:rhodanese-related sulfurtransferase